MPKSGDFLDFKTIFRISVQTFKYEGVIAVLRIDVIHFPSFGLR